MRFMPLCAGLRRNTTVLSCPPPTDGPLRRVLASTQQHDACARHSRSTASRSLDHASTRNTRAHQSRPALAVYFSRGRPHYSDPISWALVASTLLIAAAAAAVSLWPQCFDLLPPLLLSAVDRGVAFFLLHPLLIEFTRYRVATHSGCDMLGSGYSLLLSHLPSPAGATS